MPHGGPGVVAQSPRTHSEVEIVVRATGPSPAWAETRRGWRGSGTRPYARGVGPGRGF